MLLFNTDPLAFTPYHSSNVNYLLLILRRKNSIFSCIINMYHNISINKHSANCIVSLLAACQGIAVLIVQSIAAYDCAPNKENMFIRCNVSKFILSINENVSRKCDMFYWKESVFAFHCTSAGVAAATLGMVIALTVIGWGGLGKFRVRIQ